jgi:hypothetical protein
MRGDMAIIQTDDGERYPQITDEPIIRTPPPEQLEAFEDLYWLFDSGPHNRSTARIDFDEAALLFRTTKRSRGSILEIGRRHGGSTLIMLVASQGRHMISVDFEPNHFPTADQFLHRSHLTRNLKLVIGNSREPISDAAFGMIFFDGDHSFKGLRLDVLAHWSSLQALDGVPALCAFHDVDHLRLENPWDSFNLETGAPIDTVTPVVCKLLQSGAARLVATAGTMCVLEKQHELSAEF